MEVSVDGTLLATLKAKDLAVRKWHTVDLSKTNFEKSLNKVTITPVKDCPGGFALHVDPDGSNWSAYKDAEVTDEWVKDLSPDFDGEQAGSYTIATSKFAPAESPLKVGVIPLENSRLVLQGAEMGLFAAELSPEGKAKILPVDYDGDKASVDLGDVYIYSVVVMGKDKKQIEEIAARNDNTRPIYPTSAYSKILNALTEYEVESYSASSSHWSAPVEKPDKGVVYWLDGTPGKYPDWIEAKLKANMDVNKVMLVFDKNVVSSDFRLQGYKIELGEWVTLAKVADNKDKEVILEFPPIVTMKFRVVFTKGAPTQNYKYSSIAKMRFFKKD